MGCNYYFKNTGLDYCIILIAVMIIIRLPGFQEGSYEAYGYKFTLNSQVS